MFKKRTCAAVVMAVTLAFLPGCNLGHVHQGRVIGFDTAKGLMTVVLESDNLQPQPGHVVPAVTVKVPVDPGEMGPAPESGKLLALNLKYRTVAFYDCGSNTVRTFNYTPVAENTQVRSDDPRVAKVKFPVINRPSKSVTLYSARQHTLVTFVVPDEYLALPDDTWKYGDEVRYYYKQPDQALRLMNVSKTDLTKDMK